MLVKNAFRVSCGHNYSEVYKSDIYVYQLNVTDFDDCVISKPSKTIKYNGKVSDKNVLSLNDIIISKTTKGKKAHVGYVSQLFDKDTFISNNLIVLRSSTDKYDPLFVAEYLDKIIIPEKLNGKDNYKFEKDDIEKMELPDIPLDEQKKLVSFFSLINKRTALYKEIIDNNNKIKLSLLERLKQEEKHENN